MSLESGSNASAAAPLQYEIWNELRVKAQPDSWLPPYPLHNTNYFFKLMHDTTTSTFCLIVTDLCFVWLRRYEQKQIDQDMKKFNPSIRKKTTNHTITMVAEMLKENSAQQFHLVRLDAPEDDDAARGNSFTPMLHLESSMSLGGLITFKWQFDLHSYGGPLEQCAFLRSQMYLPLHEMIKILSFQVQAERRRYEKLQASLSSGSGSGPSAAAAAATSHHHNVHQDPSLSLSLPSLSTAERERQAQRLAAGGAPTAESFDAYANGFTFGQVGQVYVSALSRLSGEDPSQMASQPSIDPFPSSQPPPSPNIDQQEDEDRKRRPTAAERRRGVKRDRSPSPSPSGRQPASSSAAAAPPAAGSYAYDRDADIDYKHSEDLPQPSIPHPASGEVGASLLNASMQSSIDMGGQIDEEGNYHESEGERLRKAALAKSLQEARQKKKKKKAFV